MAFGLALAFFPPNALSQFSEYFLEVPDRKIVIESVLIYFSFVVNYSFEIEGDFLEFIQSVFQFRLVLVSEFGRADNQLNESAIKQWE